MPIRDFLFLHQLMVAVRACWFRGVFVFLLIFAAVVGATAVWPRTYQSEARIYVRLGRETVSLDPTASMGQTVSIAESREREVTSVLELIKSRGLCEEVVDQLGVDSFLNEERVYGYGGLSDWSHLLEGHWEPPVAGNQTDSADETTETEASPEQPAKISDQRRRESAIRLFMDAVACKSPRNSNVIVITCSAASPETAQRRLECLLEKFQSQHVRINRISGSFDFFDVQVQERKQRLDAKLLERRDLKNRLGVDSIEGQRELLKQEAVAITQSLLQAQAQRAAAEARLKALEANLAEADRPSESADASGSSADAIDLMRSKLFELEIEQQSRLSTFQPNHPQVKAINQQVAQAKLLLRKQEILVERGTMLEQGKKIDAAKDQRGAVDAKLQSFNEHEVALSEIDRQVALLEAEYRKADENRELARLDDELKKSQISNVNLAQPPSFTAKPSAPSLPRNLLLGMVISLGSAFLVVIQGALSKGVLHSAEEPVAVAVATLPSARRYPPVEEPAERAPQEHALSNGV